MPLGRTGLRVGFGRCSGIGSSSLYEPSRLLHSLTDSEVLSVEIDMRWSNWEKLEEEIVDAEAGGDGGMGIFS